MTEEKRFMSLSSGRHHLSWLHALCNSATPPNNLNDSGFLGPSVFTEKVGWPLQCYSGPVLCPDPGHSLACPGGAHSGWLPSAVRDPRRPCGGHGPLTEPGEVGKVCRDASTSMIMACMCGM